MVSINAIGLFKEQNHTNVCELLREYQDVFPDDLPTGLPPGRRCPFRIDLEEEARPQMKGMYRPSETETKELQQQILDLVNKAFIQPSTTPWEALVLIAANRDGICCCA